LKPQFCLLAFCLLATLALLPMPTALADPALTALPDLPLVSRTLSLRDAVALALADSFSLRGVRADAAVAAAQARAAGAQQKPSLSTTTYATTGDAANVFTTSPGVGPTNYFGVPPKGFADQDLMLMVPLYTGGRLQARTQAARSQALAADLSGRAARLAVVRDVTLAYHGVLRQEALAVVAQARVDAEDEQMRVTQEKVAAGRLAPVDLLREQAEHADALQAQLAAGNAVDLSLTEIKIALGVAPTSRITLSDTLDDLTPQDAPLPRTLEEALRQADAGRPEIEAARRQMEAAGAGVRDVRGAYAPQVYGVAMGDATATPGGRRLGYSVGLTASLPLYDGGQRRADVDAAHGRAVRAEADAEGVRQNVAREVSSAWLSLQTATAQRAAAQVGVAAAKQAYDLATLRYNAGKGITAERLDALAALTRARGGLAQATSDAVDARTRLLQAVGSGALR